jgi:hypothetical protein
MIWTISALTALFSGSRSRTEARRFPIHPEARTSDRSAFNGSACWIALRIIRNSGAVSSIPVSGGTQLVATPILSDSYGG